MFGLGLQQAALDAAHAAAGLAANWLVQSTLLIAMGLAAAWLLQCRGSAVQSAVYRTTLLAAALCPAASWLLSLAGFSGWAMPLPAAYSLLELPQPVESMTATVDAPVSSSNDGYTELSLLRSESGMEGTSPGFTLLITCDR